MLDGFIINVNDRKRGLLVAQEPMQDLYDTVRGVFSTKPPINLPRIMGAKIPGPVVDVPPCTFAVSEDKYKELEKFQLVGLCGTEAIVCSYSYRLIGFRGCIGPIDKTRSHRVRDSIIPKKIGLFFDWKTWDGADCFVPENSAYQIVTKRAVKAFEEVFPSWFAFTPLKEAEWPC